MYIAVCDDQTEELGSLTELLGAWETDRGTPVRVKSFRSAAELLDAARHERFTLYLLDIMMPGLNGMDAAREIRGFDKAADIIFLTSSPGFAYDSYIVNMLQIEELSPTGLRTFSGRELPVSRLLYPQLQKDYMKLLFAQREE